MKWRWEWCAFGMYSFSCVIPFCIICIEKKFLKDCIRGRHQQRFMNIAQNSGKNFELEIWWWTQRSKIVMLNIWEIECSLQMIDFSSGMQWHFVGMAGPYTAKTIWWYSRQALEWNLQGKWGRGRPKNTWRRTVLKEAKGINKTWAEIKADAKNRVRWRILVEALCSAAEWRDVIIILLYGLWQVVYWNYSDCLYMRTIVISNWCRKL